MEGKINGPLTTNKICKFITTTPNHIGVQRSQVVSRYNNIFWKFIRYFDEYIDPEINDVITELVNNGRDVIQGSFTSNFNCLKMMADDSRGLTKSSEDIIKILKLGGFSKIRLFKLGDVEPNYITNIVNFNKHSSPGFFTKLIVGRFRGATIGLTSKIAAHLLSILKQTPLKNWSLWEILGREKEVNCMKEGEEVQTRLVINTEEPAMLVNAIFAQLITKSISIDNNNNIFIGKKMTSYSMKGFIEKQQRRKYTLEADWSNFDVNVSEDVIKVTSSILRQCFPEDRDRKSVV